ncbi:MAG: hypothetical protein IT563_09575 [Alphaproteobacteria bacterium]|nr:hypothetical protein [Alphaproteobacteria bacterium]
MAIRSGRLAPLAVASLLAVQAGGSLPAYAAGARASGSPACRYDVAVGPLPDLVLDVAVDCGALPVERLVAVDGALPRYLAGISDATGQKLAREDDAWLLPKTGPRVARYRVELGAMGAREHDYTSAYALGGSVLAELSTWVLLPQPLPEGAVLRLAPSPAAGVGFATALEQVDGALEMPASALRYAGYSVFGRFRETRMSRAAPGALAPQAEAARRGATADVRLVTLDGPLELPAAETDAWVADTASAVEKFWQGFPVDRLLLVLMPQPARSNVPYGRVIGGGGASLMVLMGEKVAQPTLYRDWVLIHEMVHLGSPFVRRSPWMTEGFATYFEPIIRYRAGRRTAESLWAEFAQDMPRGLDAIEREGLAYTRRGIYWGGAIFMLLADMEMRERSGGKRGLEDCLRTILHGGGDATQLVSADWMIDACDRASGGDTMRRLAQRHAFSRHPVDLEDIWRRLGVIRSGDGQVRLDEGAPLAWLRRAIADGKIGAS